MAELIDLIQRIAEETHKAMVPTDLTIGTVLTVNPLSVQLNPELILPAEVLYLTESVIEKKIDLHHTHSLSAHTHSDPQGGVSGPPSTPNTDTGTLVNNPFTSAPLFSDYGLDSSSRIVTPALAQGDMVLLLRVMAGQSFVIISRVVSA